MTFTSDDLRSCYLCGTVRPVDAVVLLDTYDGGPTWLCRDKAVCLHAWAMQPTSDSASGAGMSSGDFVSFRPDDTATGVHGDAPTRLGAGSHDWRDAVIAWLILAMIATAGLALTAAATWRAGR